MLNISKKLCLLFVIGVLHSCALDTKVGNSYTDNDFVLVASATGNTIEDAKKNALVALGQLIYANVQSSLTTEEMLQNNQYTVSAIYNTVINSSSYFKGIVYYNNEKVKGQKKVSVGISKAAYIDTVKYLYTQIDEQKISYINKRQANEELQQSMFLLAILSYAKQHNVHVGSNINIDNVQSYIKQLQLIVYSEAEVKFILNRQEVKEGIVLINNQRFLPYERIFLKAGSYPYMVRAEGYKEENGSIFLRKGDISAVNIYLQPKQDNLLPVQIIVNDSSKVLNTNDIKALLVNKATNNQMQVDSSSNNKLVLNASKATINSTFNNYYIISTNISLELHIGGKLKKQTSFVINFLTKTKSSNIPTNNFKEVFKDNTNIFMADIYN